MKNKHKGLFRQSHAMQKLKEKDEKTYHEIIQKLDKLRTTRKEDLYKKISKKNRSNLTRNFLVISSIVLTFAGIGAYIAKDIHILLYTIPFLIVAGLGKVMFHKRSTRILWLFFERPYYLTATLFGNFLVIIFSDSYMMYLNKGYPFIKDVPLFLWVILLLLWAIFPFVISKRKKNPILINDDIGHINIIVPLLFEGIVYLVMLISVAMIMVWDISMTMDMFFNSIHSEMPL